LTTVLGKACPKPVFTRTGAFEGTFGAVFAITVALGRYTASAGFVPTRSMLP
jgi:hypothetical protein